MIRIERKDTKVKVCIEHSIEADQTSELWLYWGCNNAIYAELLKRHVRNKLDKLIQEIRRSEYNRGWKDAKSKKVAKDTWFSPMLRVFQ